MPVEKLGAGATKRPTTSRATYKSRDRKHPLRLTVTAEERDEIAKRAKAAGLSTASYLRAVALNKTIGSALDHAAVGDLVRVAGDQGRLGGLLKLWLVDQPGKGAPEVEVRRLLDRLGEMQGTLADIVGRV
jgi:hypothetical protein